MASSADPRDGFRRRTSAGRTGADGAARMIGDATERLMGRHAKILRVVGFGRVAYRAAARPAG